MPNANQQGWVFVQNILYDFPTQGNFRTDPHMYLVLSTTGKLVTAEPEYYQGEFTSWWSPGNGLRITNIDTLAYKPIDIPDDIAAKLMSAGKAKNSRLYKRLTNTGT